MNYNNIIYEQEKHVVPITLNRPEARNALTIESYTELTGALNTANTDHEVRAVIITGAGKGFCAGDDVKQVMLDPNRAEKRREAEKRQIKDQPNPYEMVLMMMDKPLIAAVNGAAVGWGMDLALMCDIRIASERAKFGELFVLRGIVPDFGGLYYLPLLVGLSKAYELLFTGDVIDAGEALRIGLVSKVVAPEALMDEAMAMATRIANNPPLAVQRIKEAVRRGLNCNTQDLGEYIVNSWRVLFQTEDHLEGARSFIEKRQPVFKGK